MVADEASSQGLWRGRGKTARIDPPPPRLWRAGDRRCGAAPAAARPGRWIWGRREKRTQLLVEIAQGRIVEEEGVINLRESLLHGAVRGQFVTLI